MENEKLYYQDPFCRSFEARVTGCEPGKGNFLITLDRTAFYPEGGGQPADHGTLDGVAVTDVHERDGQIFHTCTAPVEVGRRVQGELDWPRRFAHMQAHSGEHIVSGIIHRLYGYDNVGFHMGADCVTIDFDGPLTEADLARVEALANQYIWQDASLEELWPDGEELDRLEYRSKKALCGEVRIIRFPGADTCACCGTHVLRAGQVGLVKLLSVQTFRSGVRIEMLAGGAALAHLSLHREQNRAVAKALSVKPQETFAAVGRLQEELAGAKARAAELENGAFARRAEELRGQGDVLLFEEGLTPDGVRRLADAVAAACGGRCAIFSGKAGAYQYAVALPGGDLRGFTKQMNETLHGRGGGKPHFVQGGVAATRAEIEAFFENK